MAQRGIIAAIGISTLTVALSLFVASGADPLPWFIAAIACFGLLVALDNRHIRSQLPFPPYEVVLDRLYRMGKQLQDDVIHSTDPSVAGREGVLARMSAWDADLRRELDSRGSRGHVLLARLRGWVTDEGWETHVRQAISDRLEMLEKELTKSG